MPATNPASVTWWEIRDNYDSLIRAAIPRLLPNFRFDACPRNYELSVHAGMAGSASLRKFQFDRSEIVEDPPFFHWETREVNEHMLLTMAYPTQYAIYGRDDSDDMDKVIRSDAHQLRDLIFSGGNYLVGQSAAFVKILPPLKEDPRVIYQPYDIELIYTERESLT